MKKRNVLKEVIIIVILVTLLYMPIVNLAHSGRTDSSGGHKDNKNASGLGSYHYHCGGHPAHLHTGGVCPYSSSAAPATTSTTSSSTSSAATSSKTTTTPKKVVANKVEVNVDELNLIIGESKSLTAVVSPSNAEDKSVTWKSSNKEIAMVDSEGEVLALGIGETVVTVSTANGKKASVKVIVNPIKVTEIKLNETEIKLNVDETVTLTADVFPSNATDKNVTWSSENPEIAIVEGGEVKAIALGTTKIICRAKDEIKAEVNVIVEEIVEENIIEENTIEVVAKNIENDENNNSKNEEIQNSTEITTWGRLGGFIAFASIIGLPIYGLKRRNKEEKFSIKKCIGNLISYLVCFVTLLISVSSTSIIGLVLTLSTALSIAPPICKIINQKFDGKYTVKIRIITYIVGFIFMIVIL